MKSKIMHTCVVITVTLFLKATEDESCRSLVNVLKRDLKDTFTVSFGDVVLATETVVVVDTVVDSADTVVEGTGPAVKIF